MEAAIVVSGGMDSITLLHEFKAAIKLVINFQYGSKHNRREAMYAAWHARLLGKEFITVELPFIGKLFNSCLLQGQDEIPEGHYADESMKRTVVPFRNGIMLSIATGLAESKGLDTLLIGNHFGDHAIYPDCRQDFIKPMAEAIKKGTYTQVDLLSPYCHIDKRAIGLRGKELQVDYSMTWTCYKGQDVHCGKCGACTERKEALLGFDPTVYAS